LDINLITIFDMMYEKCHGAGLLQRLSRHDESKKIMG